MCFCRMTSATNVVKAICLYICFLQGNYGIAWWIMDILQACSFFEIVIQLTQNDELGGIDMAKQAKLSKIEFQQKFSTEEACEQQLFQMKWPNGYRCEKCSSEHYSTITTRNLPLYQCNKCGYQATVIVHTIFEKTRTPLTKWFIAIYGMTTDKRGYSATQLAKDIEVSYPTAWLILHKIREAMGNRDERYRLSGIVEMDESYSKSK